MQSQAPAATRVDRRPTTWRIDVDYRGSRRALHLEPDGIFAVAHSQLASPQDRKFFFLEIDRGTMPVVRSRVEQTSILRKLVAYQATFRAGIHRSRFGIDNMRVLIVGKSRERTATIIEAFQEHLAGKVSPKIFLAADRPTLFGSGTGLHVTEWVDLEGNINRRY